MQLSQKEQQAFERLKTLLNEDYLSTDQKTDLLAESTLALFNRWIKDEYCDEDKSEKTYYLFRHLVDLLRTLDEIKDSLLSK